MGVAEIQKMSPSTIAMGAQHNHTAVNHTDWLSCRRAALLLVGCPHSLVCYISQLRLRDSFSVSQQPPIWEPPSHYSMIAPRLRLIPETIDINFVL